MLTDGRVQECVYLCGAAVSNDTEETELALNGKKTKLRKKDFLALAASCGLSPTATEKMIRRLIGKTDTMISIAQNAEIPDDIRMGCIELIGERAAVFDRVDH